MNDCDEERRAAVRAYVATLDDAARLALWRVLNYTFIHELEGYEEPQNRNELRIELIDDLMEAGK